MTTDGLSYWQDESAGIDLFDTAIGDLLDRRAKGSKPDGVKGRRTLTIAQHVSTLHIERKQKRSFFHVRTRARRAVKLGDHHHSSGAARHLNIES